MKNIFRTVLLTALACLLCFSCTNINDPETLKAEQFAVADKMYVEGFIVEGLNTAYDGTTVKLIRNEAITTTVVDSSKEKQADPVETVNPIELASAKVADSAKFHKEGTAYVKLEKPVLIQDKATTTVEEGTVTTTVSYSYSYYLDIEGVKVQVLNDKYVSENSSLKIVPSPYGTKDENLAKKMLVVKTSGIEAIDSIPATFNWEDSSKVAEPKIIFYIIGDITKNKFKELTAVDATTQTYEFKYTASDMTEWGGSLNGGVYFKMTDKGAWGNDTTEYGSDNADIVRSLDTAFDVNGGANIKVKLVDNETYIIKLDLSGATPKCTVSLKEK